MDPRRFSAQPVGNTSLTRFDALIIGSGAGGSSVAAVLTRQGLNVLIIEAGPNYFSGLDNPDASKIQTLFSHDALKLMRRNFIMPNPITEPRSYRPSEADGDRTDVGVVNHLAQLVGGCGVHADLKTPRYIPADFRLGTLLGDVAGANYADWPVNYDMLEPFYAEIEAVLGVQGEAGANPVEGPRSTPFPLPPGAPMYLGLKLSEGAKKLGYHPFPFPTAVNSRPYGGRAACTDCGFCSSFGCVISAKGSPAVTTLRNALLTGRCLVLPETRVVKILSDSSGRKVTGVETLGPDGSRSTYTADRYVLAASPIESARLLLSSGPGGDALGNSSGMVGRNLMFHVHHYAMGIFEERLHGHRGRTTSHGMADFRGIPGDPDHPLGGIIEFCAGPDPLDESVDYALQVDARGPLLKNLMQESPLRDHMAVMLMQAEDAPQVTNRVDLDPDIRDLDGRPVPRITYQNHAMELSTRDFYLPKMVQILGAAGAKYAFTAPLDQVPNTHHVMGALRFGADPKTSVCDPTGRLHDLENLFAADGSLFPTAAGFNPTLTIMALATRVAGEMVFPGSPERALLR